MLRLTDSHRFSSSVFISAYLLLLINIAVASTDRYDVHVPSTYVVRYVVFSDTQLHYCYHSIYHKLGAIFIVNCDSILFWIQIKAHRQTHVY